MSNELGELSDQALNEISELHQNSECKLNGASKNVSNAENHFHEMEHELTDEGRSEGETNTFSNAIEEIDDAVKSGKGIVNTEIDKHADEWKEIDEEVDEPMSKTSENESLITGNLDKDVGNHYNEAANVSDNYEEVEELNHLNHNHIENTPSEKDIHDDKAESVNNIESVAQTLPELADHITGNENDNNENVINNEKEVAKLESNANIVDTAQMQLDEFPTEEVQSTNKTPELEEKQEKQKEEEENNEFVTDAQTQMQNHEHDVSEETEENVKEFLHIPMSVQPLTTTYEDIHALHVTEEEKEKLNLSGQHELEENQPESYEPSAQEVQNNEESDDKTENQNKNIESDSHTSDVANNTNITPEINGEQETQIDALKAEELKQNGITKEHQEEPDAKAECKEHLRSYIVRPRNNPTPVIRWDAVPYETSEDSDDEFEMATCMKPIYANDSEIELIEKDQINRNIKFANGKPDYEGQVTSCFDEPHLLYRIVNNDQKTWAFYNDSISYEMHVQFIFGKSSKVEPLGATTMTQNDKGAFVMEVTVYPLETELFVKGKANGYTSKLRAIPLGDEYHEKVRSVTSENINEEINAIRAVCDSDNAEEVLQACITNNLPFVDPEFPPVQASIEQGAQKQFKHLAWARPEMYVEKELINHVRLFRSTICPGDVDFGDLGDSWVMCSAASLAEDASKVKALFRHPNGKAAAQQEHAVGAYRVMFNKNGWWRSVLVDSYLPISAGRPKFSKGASDLAEIWPSILEKAFAKLHGSYAKICTGDPLHALQDMTGFPTHRFDDISEITAHGTADYTLFDDIISYLNANYTTVCSTPGKDFVNSSTSTSSSQPEVKDKKLTTTYKSVGLLTGYAYTVLDAKYFPETNLRLVKFRNAYNRNAEWNGDWCNNDNKWNEFPEVAEACDFESREDNTFWMPWELVTKYFNGGGVCFTHVPSCDYRINCVFDECVPSAILDINVHTPTWMTFVLSQEDRRCREEKTEYQPVMLSLAEDVDEEMCRVIINSSANGIKPSSDRWTFLQARDISMIRKFEPGHYMIIPRMMPVENQPERVPFILSVVSNHKINGTDVSVSFKRIPAQNRVYENFPKFERELEDVNEVQIQKREFGAAFPETVISSHIE